jgi:hypothetical protein
MDADTWRKAVVLSCRKQFETAASFVFIKRQKPETVV